MSQYKYRMHNNFHDKIFPYSNYGKGHLENPNPENHFYFWTRMNNGGIVAEKTEKDENNSTKFNYLFSLNIEISQLSKPSNYCYWHNRLFFSNQKSLKSSVNKLKINNWRLSLKEIKWYSITKRGISGVGFSYDNYHKFEIVDPQGSSRIFISGCSIIEIVDTVRRFATLSNFDSHQDYERLSLVLQTNEIDDKVEKQQIEINNLKRRIEKIEELIK